MATGAARWQTEAAAISRAAAGRKGSRPSRRDVPRQRYLDFFVTGTWSRQMDAEAERALDHAEPRAPEASARNISNSASGSASTGRRARPDGANRRGITASCGAYQNRT